MFTVELIKNVDDVGVCKDFDFETITEAYAFMWQCRDLWIDPDYDMILYKDDEIYGVFDDYSLNS